MSKGSYRQPNQQMSEREAYLCERRTLAKSIFVELIAKNRSIDYQVELWVKQAWSAADAFLAAEPPEAGGCPSQT